MDDSLCSECCDSEDYKMKRLKSSVLDRLSELPDSLLLKIISLLEMREVVCTSLLSKRWKDLWTTIPCLDFSESWDDSTDESCYSLVSTRNFISRALMLYKGVQIREFKIQILNSFEKSLFTDLDLWVRYANERKVEVLYVELETGPEYYYLLPQCLYSCSSIRQLSLRGCELQIRGKVQWDQLKKLKFEGHGLNQNTIYQIVSGSPQLEVLEVEILEGYRNLTIQSNSLKRLSIRKNTSYTEFDPSNYTVLTICASNLETLALYGDAYSEYSLIGVSSLIDVTLDFVEKWVPALEMTLRQILNMIQHVEAVTLSNCCLKVLRVMKSKYPLSPLLNVKLLKISCPIDPHELVCYLEIFPKLEMLVVGWDLYMNYVVQSGNILCLKRVDAFEFDGDIFLKSEAMVLESFLSHLRTVEVGWYSYEASLFQFIEFLLKHATVIEKIVIRERRILAEPTDRFVVEQKVQSLQRSFPTVELNLCSLQWNDVT